MIATIVALVWANSPWRESYEMLWSTEVRIGVGSYVFEEDLAHIVNDALMAIFFFVVGMEIKRELVVGEQFNAGGAGASGWGIPMATDISRARRRLRNWGLTQRGFALQRQLWRRERVTGRVLSSSPTGTSETVLLFRRS